MEKFENVYYRPHLAFLAEQCPSSLLRNPDFIPSEQIGVPATVGTACHELFRTVCVPRQPMTEEVIAEFAKKHNVEADGFEGIGWRANKMKTSYEKICEKGFLETPTSEEEWNIGLSNGYKFSCHPDLYELHPPWAVVLDLKTGLVDVGWQYQVRDYCTALLKKFSDLGLKKVYGITFAPVLDYYDVKSYSAEELLESERKLVSQIEKAGKHYVVGDGCKYCKNLLNCPAIKRQIDPISKDIMSAGGRQAITGEEVKKWRGPIAAMKKIVEAYESAEKLLIDAKGSIDLGDGRELYLREQYKRTVDVGKAITVLCDDFGVEKPKFIERLEMKTKDIEALSDTTAPPRGKSKQRKAVWQLLEEKGGLTKKLQKVKATRKTTK